MVYDQIIEVLNDMGIILFDDISDDFDISEYINESVTFINFIVKMEEKIGLELSEDFFDYSLLESARGLAEKIVNFMDNGHSIIN